MRKLERLILELEKNISHHELMIPDISKGSVGWHIEHSLLVLNLVTGALAKSNPGDYKGKFDIKRAVVMLTQKIPRGKFKVPTAVQPSTNFNRDTLEQHIILTREKLRTLKDLSPRHFFTHPFLGDTKLKPATKFLFIHTNHHYHIIQDIVKSKS